MTETGTITIPVIDITDDMYLYEEIGTIEWEGGAARLCQTIPGCSLFVQFDDGHRLMVTSKDIAQAIVEYAKD